MGHYRLPVLNLPYSYHPPDRSAGEQANAERLVCFLICLDEWRLARVCELILRHHLGPVIEVRPATRPEREEAAA